MSTKPPGYPVIDKILESIAPPAQPEAQAAGEARQHCGQPMRYDVISNGDVFDGQRLTGTWYCEKCCTMQPTYAPTPEQPALDAGERWEIYPGGFVVVNGKTLASTTNEEAAELIVRNARLAALVPELMAALREIERGEGAFSLDHKQHAINTIDNMKTVAQTAIANAASKGVKGDE